MMGIAVRSSTSAVLPDWSRQDDVALNFKNDTAIVTLREGQKAGPIIVNLIRPDRRVVFDEIDEEVPTVLRTGGATTVCEQVSAAASSEQVPALTPGYRVEVLEVTSETARFEITKKVCCLECRPICWHIYQPEIYDKYIASLTAGLADN